MAPAIASRTGMRYAVVEAANSSERSLGETHTSRSSSDSDLGSARVLQISPRTNDGEDGSVFFTSIY